MEELLLEHKQLKEVGELDPYRDIRHILDCPVCFQRYNRPKRLKCEHVFCVSCLTKLICDGIITCPECRRLTTVPSPSSLPNCVVIQRFLDALFSDVNHNEDVCRPLNNPFGTFEHSDTTSIPQHIRVNYQPTFECLTKRKLEVEENINYVRNSIDYVIDKLIQTVQERRIELKKEVDCFQSGWLKPLENQLHSLEKEIGLFENRSLIGEQVTDNQTNLSTEIIRLPMRSASELSNIMTAFECGEVSLSGIEKLQTLLDEVMHFGKISESETEAYPNRLRYEEEKQQVTVLTDRFKLHGNFGPRGMCTIDGSDDMLVVVDSSNNKCYMFFEDSHNVPFTLNVNNSGKNECFTDVTSLCHCKPTRFVFCDYSSSILKIFDRQGNDCGHIDIQSGASFPQMPTPFSVASDIRDNIFIVDKRNRTIQVRQESGALIRQFECRGSPGYIAVWNDLLVVSDAGNKCCYIYSVDGSYLSTIGQHTGINFSLPMGVAFHCQGFILISDYLKRSVFAVNISGRKRYEIDVSKFRINPEGIAVQHNNVYISNRLNKMIIKIKLN